MFKYLILTEKDTFFEGELIIDGVSRYVFQQNSFIHPQYQVGVDKDTQKRLIIALANDYPWDNQKKHELNLIEINNLQQP